MLSAHWHASASRHAAVPAALPWLDDFRHGPFRARQPAYRFDCRRSWDRFALAGGPASLSHASRDPARVTVVPNEGERGVSLKIGQTYERASGEVRDRLEGGVITVGKPAPKIEPAKKRGAAAKPPAPAR